MDKDLNDQIASIEKTIDLIAKEDEEATRTLGTIFNGLKRWGCQGSDFSQIREELASLAQKRQRVRDETRELKEERKLIRKGLDEKIVSLKEEIETIQASNQEIQAKMNQLPLILELMKAASN